MELLAIRLSPAKTLGKSLVIATRVLQYREQRTMSIIEVKVPQLSESVSEATLVTWHKQVGEAVAEGENLIDIETDKVVLELPASKSGVVTKIIKGDGEKVTSEEVIALLDTEAQTSVQAVSKPAVEAQL